MHKNKHSQLLWEKTYSQIDKLGDGGNGEVILVNRLSDNSKFALKTLKNKSTEKKHRFITEIKTVMNNSNDIKGIIPILDYSEDEYWYVMPVATECLKHITDNNLNIEDIVNATIELTETLCKLHSRNISHRDIKPTNIYYYDSGYCFSDFGLVSTPDDDEHFTRCDIGLGAIFTIAPEMKRNPQNADGKKADVFSLAKTMWMFLTGNEKGFDGVYNFLDPNHSLRYIEKYKNIHLVELDELLKDATDNNPDNRPTIFEFKERLIEWTNIYKDDDKSQMSDWRFLDKQLFGKYPPESASWKDTNKIIEVLNIISMTPAFNHMLFSENGGLDFDCTKKGNEESFIEIYASGFCNIVKPKQLIYEGFGDNCEWNYFLLELDCVPPIISENRLEYEELVEDTPAHYVSASTAQYGVYDYDTGIPFPDGYRVVHRYTSGKFLIVMKNGPYNQITGTYDGRHGMCNSFDFRNYIQSLSETYFSLSKVATQDEPSQPISERELKRIILKLPMFNKNPFVKSESDSHSEQRIIKKSSKTKPSKTFLRDNYTQLCFKDDFDTDNNFEPKIRFYFKFNLPDGICALDFLGVPINCICNDGYINEVTSLLDSDGYYVYDRTKAIQLRDKFESTINNFLIQKTLQPLRKFEHCITIKSIKVGKPTHLFTKPEIEEVMRNADDRYSNQLVIDENGYPKIIQNDGKGLLYPVRHEPWDAGNVYVGKYSKLLTLDENYISSLQGWLTYLKTGKNQFIDYVQENKDEEALLEEIKEYY